jgi:lipopolysaccharide transport system ATP-binding protein
MIGPNSAETEEQAVWALRNASFSIEQGESVGIVGRNGAGKSTLLKVLSRVTKPTQGSASVRGRVGTLLEVGTGFHPELTGRDNIFLSGTILGMTYGEVAKKFDEIVAFAEVERFIDTPVKRYSSGMYVRLAFAVASCLDPEILIVDEVLAVGDAAFQRKSLGRLNDASAHQGRTVLFVSHNLQAIRTFCRRVILLEKGEIVFDGPMQQGLERYLRAIPKNVDVRSAHLKDRLHRTSGTVRFTDVECLDETGASNWEVRVGGTFKLNFSFEAFETVPSLAFFVRMRTALNGESLTALREVVSRSEVKKGSKGTITLTFPDIALRPCEISFYAALTRADQRISYDVIDENVDLPLLTIVSEDSNRDARDGIVSLPYRFEISDLSGDVRQIEHEAR